MAELLTQTQATTYSNTAIQILTEMCGENWKKDFLKAKEEKHKKSTEKIEFALPVLANIVMSDLWGADGMPVMSKSKLANMTMKKIHDHDPEHVYKLLSSFMTNVEIAEKWNQNKSRVDDAVVKGFEKILKASWYWCTIQQTTSPWEYRLLVLFF